MNILEQLLTQYFIIKKMNYSKKEELGRNKIRNS